MRSGRLARGLLAGVATMAAGMGLLRGEYVWIEAEEPKAGNFPPPDAHPFTPREFWEEAALSAGRWIGRYWDEDKEPRPFLEYEFETREAGRFDFYARKFYTFGNFRWRVDEGDWQETPISLHEEIDSETVRDTPTEKFTATWHYMGAISLEPGRHRLRIEPMPGRIPTARPGENPLPGHPMAYDVFLFTNEPFFPSGTLKPGDKHQARIGKGFAFQAAADPFVESPIDWRSLNEAVAGERGGLTIRNGTLVDRADSAPARLLGVNVRPGPSISPASSAYRARLLAKRGVNLIRVDIGTLFTGGRDAAGRATLACDDLVLEMLLRMMADAREQGIYTALTWNLANVRNASILGRFDPASSPYPGDFSLHALFDEQLQDEVIKGWLKVLAAKLPGGKTPLAREPALAFLTLGQQVSAFAQAGIGEPPLPPALLEAREQAFRKWLIGRDGDLRATLARWGLPGEVPASLLPPLEELVRSSDARGRDAVRFLAESQRAWMDKLAGAIRKEAGYEGLISYSNRPTAFPETLGLASAWASAEADLQERAALLLTPFQPASNYYVQSAGARFLDRSALRPGREAALFDLPLRAISFNGRPMALTEVGWTAPNRFRGEAPLLSLLAASIQGVPIVAFEGLHGVHWHQSLASSRLPVFTPGILGQFSALGYAFRKGLLPGPFQVARLAVPTPDVFSLDASPIADLRESRILSRPAAHRGLGDDEPGEGLFLNGQVQVEFVEDGQRREMVVDEGALAGLSQSPMRLAHDSVTWDSGLGLMTVEAPAFVALAGFLGEAEELQAGPLEIETRMPFAVVCLVALDGKPLDFSERMLLQVFTEEGNAGQFIEDGGMSVVRSLGRPPLTIATMEGKITLARPDAEELLVTALDANGYPLVPVGRAHDFRLLPATMYYLLEK